MKSLSILSKFIVMALILSISVPAAMAQITAPYNFSAKFAYLDGDYDNPYDLKMSWMDDNDTSDINGYRVYYKKITKDNENDYEVLVSTINNNLIINNSDDIDFTTKSYTFYVTAYTDSVESAPSNVITTIMGRNYNDGDIADRFREQMSIIISEPETNGRTGINYDYDVQVMQDMADEQYFDILFKLLNSPEGMFIDEKTGEISWVPGTNGIFNVEVASVVEGEVQSRQLWSIQVEGVSGVGDKYGSDFTVYPNPASDMITLRLKASQGEYEVSIIDVSGRRLSTSNSNFKEGLNTFTVNTNGLAVGVYTIAVSKGDVIYKSSFIIVR